MKLIANTCIPKYSNLNGTFLHVHRNNDVQKDLKEALLNQCTTE